VVEPSVAAVDASGAAAGRSVGAMGAGVDASVAAAGATTATGAC